MVENGVKSGEERGEQRGHDDNDMAEDSVISMIGADDEEVKQVRVKADVSPETAGQSVAQPLPPPSVPPPPPPAVEEAEHPVTVTAMSLAGQEQKQEPVDVSVEVIDPATSTIVTVEIEEPTTRVTYIVSA